jgi:hypothetical protein
VRRSSNPHDLQFAVVQGCKGQRGGPGQCVVGGQGVGETQLAMVGRLVEHRADFPGQPLRIEVQHAVGEAVGGGGFAVMNVARLEQEHLARRALVPGPATVELLHPLLGDAHQVAVVPVRIVGVPLEMRAQGLDAGVGVLGQVDPVSTRHAAPVRRIAGLFNARGAGDA